MQLRDFSFFWRRSLHETAFASWFVFFIVSRSGLIYKRWLQFYWFFFTVWNFLVEWVILNGNVVWRKKVDLKKKYMKTHCWAYVNFINGMLNRVSPKGLVLGWTQIKQTSNPIKIVRPNSDLIQTKVHSSKLNLDPLLELFSRVSHIEWESTKKSWLEKKITWKHIVEPYMACDLRGRGSMPASSSTHERAILWRSTLTVVC